MKKIISFILISILITGCTSNQRTKMFGGTETIDVEQGKRVVMATWESDKVFYVIEDMPSDYTPQDKKLIEVSSFGIFESEVIFHEQR